MKIFKLLVKTVLCILIVIETCAITGESILCSTCTCENSIINCTENGNLDVLDLWDYEANIKNATLMHFAFNNIMHVKVLPPSKVKYLSLRHNSIIRIDSSAFSNLQLLAELDLSYNRLTSESLNADVFKVLTYTIFILHWCIGGRDYNPETPGSQPV